MKIKKGDTVKIMSGKDAGKTGKVTQILPSSENRSTGKVVVEGLHIMVKHMKPQKQGEKGQRLEFSAPVNSSNVQLICPKCNKVTRVASKVLTDGKRQRICRKCNEAI